MSQTKAQLVGGVGFSTADSLTVHNGLAVTGVVTATSFSGDGSGLIGVASTDNIITGTAATFNGGVKVTNGLVVTGISTFNTAIDVNAHVEFQAGSGNSQLYMFDENAVNFGSQNDGRIIYNNSGNIVKFERSGSSGEIEIDAAPVTLQHSDSTKLQTSTTGVTVTGDISATTGTFTGNVTIGGTLTYDDVTNVDSIGLVTARSGVQFGLAGVGGSVSGTGNANFAGIVTATSLDASIAFWTLGASGTDHYTFTGPGDLSGDTDPDLQLIRGQKYIFKNRSGGHPFRIQSTPNGSSGTAYNDGVTNNDAGNGTDLIFDVPFDAPSILYYQCTSHGNMGGRIYIGSSSGDDVNVGLAITMYASSGIVSATSFYGDGANITGIAAGGSNVEVVTSNTTLEANKNYMLASSGLVVTLPASPSTGDALDILNNVTGIHTVGRNGSTIQDLSEDMEVTQQGLQFKIWYTGSTWSLF